MNDQMINDFFNIGYIYIKNVFNKDEIQKIKDCSYNIELKAKNIKETQLVDGSQIVMSNTSIMRAVWAGASEPYLLEIAQDSRILKPVSKILGSQEMDHLINQLHYKRPGDQVEFTWHQDSEHRRYGTDMWKDVNGKGSYVQTLIAIDPMENDNGPLMIFEGSASRGHLDLKYDKEAFNKIKEKDATIINMMPGDLLLFGPYLIHGSKANNSNASRRVLINGYSYPGANSREYPGVGSGRKLTYKR